MIAGCSRSTRPTATTASVSFQWRASIAATPSRSGAGARRGEVGSISMTASKAWPSCSRSQARACRVESSELVRSCANAGGRRKGTRAPQASATSAMAWSSVETTTEASAAHWRAASMLQAISGLPPSRRMFFPGQALAAAPGEDQAEDAQVRSCVRCLCATGERDDCSHAPRPARRAAPPPAAAAAPASRAAAPTAGARAVARPPARAPETPMPRRA